VFISLLILVIGMLAKSHINAHQGPCAITAVVGIGRSSIIFSYYGRIFLCILCPKLLREVSMHKIHLPFTTVEISMCVLHYRLPQKMLL